MDNAMIIYPGLKSNIGPAHYFNLYIQHQKLFKVDQLEEGTLPTLILASATLNVPPKDSVKTLLKLDSDEPHLLHE